MSILYGFTGSNNTKSNDKYLNNPKRSDTLCPDPINYSHYYIRMTLYVLCTYVYLLSYWGSCK